MSSTNDAGLALAREVVNEYASSSGLVMALVVGSVARGIADGASDVDIYFGREVPRCGRGR